MILTAHQPLYLPWTGLFHKIAQADAFVFFDSVQFEYHEFGNRNRIMTGEGPLMLTVPVERKGHLEKPICEIGIADPRFATKHVRTLRMAYGKAPYFALYMDELEEILCKGHRLIADLNIELTVWLMQKLGCVRPWQSASKMGIAGKGSDLVLDMCVKAGASMYIFGAHGRDYADVDAFRAKGVEPRFQMFTPPVYRQVHRRGFVPGLSVIDLLFNRGPDSLAVIKAQNPA